MIGETCEDIKVCK